MRNWTALLALVVGLLTTSAASAQTTQQSPYVTQTIGNQGSSSSWFSSLSMPRLRLENLFNPFRTIGYPGANSTTFVNPTTNQMEYLQQFGYSRPARR